MIRLGLCCMFRAEPIKFRTSTLAYLGRVKNPFDHISGMIIENLLSLKKSLEYCYAHSIGCFRINSQFFPACSHPDWAYTIDDLPGSTKIFALLKECDALRNQTGIRLTMHPDQFIVLNSSKKEVVERAIAELNYHAYLADFLAIDVINIHGGGVYGDKKQALSRFKTHYGLLSEGVKKRLTVENDDKSYTPADLLPLCFDLSIPLVYDVHHHRCLKDHLSVEEATEQAVKTWNREPLFHLSSPLEGWEGSRTERHHDFIASDDFPDNWKQLSITVEVEAKAKELAVCKLKEELQTECISLWSGASS